MTINPESTIILRDKNALGSMRASAVDLDPANLSLERNDRIAVDAARSSGDLTRRVDETTRELLRQRLMIASVILVSVMIAVTIVSAITDQIQSHTFLIRSFATTVLTGIFFFLRRFRRVSQNTLRTVEVFVVAIPIMEMMSVLVLQSESLVAAGKASEVATLRVAIGSAVSLVIAIYGMFIPARWIRTAFVTGIAACMPTMVGLIHAQFNEALRPGEFASIALVSMTTLAMAVVATVGSRIVHAMRREVEAARQYGQYRLLDEIGRGSMGIVYKAEHRLLKRPAAIKLIRSDSATDEAAIARFEQEVHISTTLSHWNTVQIYDYGRTDHGDFYYVMEYLNGHSLQQLLQTRGSLGVRDSLVIVRQICDGLQEAHARGMVHRDLKPANIFLAEIGGQHDVVKILDFGLAVIKSSDSTTDGHSICGTPAYMSPEKIRGGEIDGRADIYAIGCLIFECLTGHPPFEADSASGLFKHHLNDLPQLNLLPESARDLRPIIAKCLGKKPEDRYADVQALRARCDAIVESHLLPSAT